MLFKVHKISLIFRIFLRMIYIANVRLYDEATDLLGKKLPGNFAVSGIHG